MESPFDVLGVEPGADEREIDRAYRERIKEVHPDHGGTAEAFQRVRAAYERITAGEGVGPGDPDRGRGAREGSADAGDARTGADRPDANPTVEYLNYEVLDDHAWELDDGDLFEKAAAAGLDPSDHGRFVVERGETLLEAAENRGFAWPYACRGGACANCAVAIAAGELSMPVNHVLPAEMTDRGFRLSCVGAPATEEMKVVYNVKHLPGLDELRLPADRFDRANVER